MSEPVRCECCGKTGRRPRGFPAPREWYYMETSDEETPDDILIVYACSEACSRKLWAKGPGPRWTEEQC